MARRRFAPLQHSHVGEFLTEAPNDGTQYVRKSLAWAALTVSGETNDLSSVVTWADIPIANVPTGTNSVTVALGNHLHTGIYSPVAHLHDSITDTNLLDKSAVETVSGSYTFTGIPHFAVDTEFDTQRIYFDGPFTANLGDSFVLGARPGAAGKDLLFYDYQNSRDGLKWSLDAQTWAFTGALSTTGALTFGSIVINTGDIASSAINGTLIADLAVLEQHLADNAVALDKLDTATFRPVQLVDTLPTLPDAAYPVDSIVLLSTDSKIYRNSADSWTAAVPTTDLSGTVSLDTQVSGTLATSLAEAGLINTNVTIAADGTLSGAGGGQVTLTSLTGALDLNTKVSGTLSTSFAEAGLINTNVTINADGTLSGAGAGTPQLQAIGGNLDLNTQVSGTLSTSFAEAGLINSGVTINADGTLSGAGAGQASLTSLPGSIQAGSIAANAVTAGTIAALSIVAGDIAATTITGAKMVAGAIDTAQLNANAVTAAKIDALTITAAEIAATTITGAKMVSGTVDTLQLSALAVTTAKLDAGAVTAAKIFANTITASEIFAGTITATEIATDTIVAGNIAAGAIDTSELAALAVTAAKIAANTITANEIFAGTITATELTGSTLSVLAADMGALTAGTITLNSSGHIKSGQTAYAAGTGFWLGLDGGTAKFSIGDSSANSMTWDGTTLRVKGTINIGAYTAVEVNQLAYAPTERSTAAAFTVLKEFSLPRDGAVILKFQKRRFASTTPPITAEAQYRVLSGTTVKVAATDITNNSYQIVTHTITLDDDEEALTIEVRGGSDDIGAFTGFVKEVQVFSGNTSGELVITD